MNPESFNKKPIPESVREVILKGDTEAHKRISSAGGKAAGVSNALLKAQREAYDAEVLKDAEKHAEENRIAWDDDYKP